MFFYIDSNYQVCGNAGQYRFKRGDDLELCLIFIGEKGYPVSLEFVDVVFGAKLPGDYAGNFLAYTNEFTPGLTAEGDPCLRGMLKLNSSELAASLGTEDYRELSAEFEFNRLNSKSSSQTISLHIHNDLIKGVEDIPAGTTPDYATKSYVDTAVSSQVSESLQAEIIHISGMRDQAVDARTGAVEAQVVAETAAAGSSENASLASDRADRAAQSSRDALSSRNVAAESARSAAENAQTVLESVTSLEDFAEEAADSASRSRQNADSAAASERSATTHASLAATSAAYAQNYETDAKNSAAAAGQKALEAGMSAQQAQQDSIVATEKAEAVARALEEAGALLSNVVKSLGGRSGEIALGNGLNLKVETVEGKERVTLETARVLEVDSLTLSSGSIKQILDENLGGKPFIVGRSDIPATGDDDHYYFNFGFSHGGAVLKPVRVDSKGIRYNTNLVLDGAVYVNFGLQVGFSGQPSSFTVYGATTLNGGATFNGATYFNNNVIFQAPISVNNNAAFAGDVIRLTKVSPSAMDIMNKQMVDAAISSAGGGGGSDGTWNGGIVNDPATFNGYVELTNGGELHEVAISGESVVRSGTLTVFSCMDIYGEGVFRVLPGGTFEVPPASLLVEGGSVGQVLKKAASGLEWGDSGGGVYYSESLSPYEFTGNLEELPAGWYRVEAVLFSSNGVDANSLLNAAMVSNGAIKSVMGRAYGGTDNGSCPYITMNGRHWSQQNGADAVTAMCSSIHISFLYHHVHFLGDMWMNSELMSPNGYIDKMWMRYSRIDSPHAWGPIQ